MSRTLSRPHSANRAAVAPLLQEGLRLHQAGRVGEAVALYDRVLVVDPAQPDALNLRGVAALDQGNPGAALEWLDRAITARPNVAEYHLHRGNAALAVGRLDLARSAYEEAVRLDPESPLARTNLGHVLRLFDAPDAALVQFERAIALADQFAPAHVNLGLVALDRGQLEPAEAAFRRAIALDPKLAVAHQNLGVALYRREQYPAAVEAFTAALSVQPSLPGGAKLLALALRGAGRDDEAVRAYELAIAHDPTDADALTNLGVGQARQGRLDAALVTADRAVAAAPALMATWLNRGYVRRMAGQLGEAEADLRRAVELGPTSVQAWTSLGDLLTERGMLAGAISAHRQAIAADPEYADAHWNLSLALLASGQWGPGWNEYDWRWRASSAKAVLRTVAAPRWTGQPLEGKRLVVWREQGLGDELLFATCIRDLVDRGARVTYIANPRLLTLFERSLPGVRLLPDPALSGQVLPLDEIGPADYETPLGSLPRWLRREWRSFPAKGQFLAPHRGRMAEWEDRLAELGDGARVGVCWRSGVRTPERTRHYSALDAWAPIFAVDGATWINLQYDECHEEITRAEARHGVTIRRWADVDLRNDLEGVVALIAQLDAVVTAPTVVSSFAGALGVPAWQIDSGTDWSAGGADRAPWFPSLRVVRRDEAGFDSAIDRVARELRTQVQRRSGNR